MDRNEAFQIAYALLAKSNMSGSTAEMVVLLDGITDAIQTAFNEGVSRNDNVTPIKKITQEHERPIDPTLI